MSQTATLEPPAAKEVPVNSRTYRVLVGRHIGDGTVDDDNEKVYQAGTKENTFRTTKNILKFNRGSPIPKFEEVHTSGGKTFANEFEKDQYIRDLQAQIRELQGATVDTSGLLTPKPQTPADLQRQADRATYEAMSVEDLRAHAQQEGIDLGKARTKADIIGVILTATSSSE
jgi:hypothetical protein